MALWRGETNPYLNPNYLRQVPVPINNNKGVVSFHNLRLVPGGDYTIAFMMSGWDEDPSKRCQTSIAAVSTFNIE